MVVFSAWTEGTLCAQMRALPPLGTGARARAQEKGHRRVKAFCSLVTGQWNGLVGDALNYVVHLSGLHTFLMDVITIYSLQKWHCSIMGNMTRGRAVITKSPLSVRKKFTAFIGSVLAEDDLHSKTKHRTQTPTVAAFCGCSFSLYLVVELNKEATQDLTPLLYQEAQDVQGHLRASSRSAKHRLMKGQQELIPNRCQADSRGHCPSEAIRKATLSHKILTTDCGT